MLVATLRYVVLPSIIDAPLAGFASVHLLGNHEDIMLRFHDGDVAVASSWLQYGGRQTLASYGIDCERLPSLAVLRQRMTHGVPVRHFDFLRGLKLKHRIGDYLFVHAGIRPGIGLDRQLRDLAVSLLACALELPSAARALQNGAPNIERADKLVQLIAKQKGLSHPAIDAQVALVDARLEANRKKAAAA